MTSSTEHRILVEIDLFECRLGTLMTLPCSSTCHLVGNMTKSYQTTDLHVFGVPYSNYRIATGGIQTIQHRVVLEGVDARPVPPFLLISYHIRHLVARHTQDNGRRGKYSRVTLEFLKKI